MAFPNPSHPFGAIHYIGFGVAAALIALSVSVFFPSIIPARATQVRL